MDWFRSLPRMKWLAIFFTLFAAAIVIHKADKIVHANPQRIHQLLQRTVAGVIGSARGNFVNRALGHAACRR